MAGGGADPTPQEIKRAERAEERNARKRRRQEVRERASELKRKKRGRKKGARRQVIFGYHVRSALAGYPSEQNLLAADQ